MLNYFSIQIKNFRLPAIAYIFNSIYLPCIKFCFEYIQITLSFKKNFMETTGAKKFVRMRSFFILLLSLCCLPVFSQDSLSLTLKQQLLKDWQRAKVYTLAYLNAMPADKYGFRPVDSVRSFGEQMLHLARANAGLVSIGTGFQSASAKVFFNPTFETSSVS